MDQAKKIHPGMIALALGALALIVFIALRASGGAQKDPAGGDVAALIPQVRETTPPPPPGVPMPQTMASLKKASK